MTPSRGVSSQRLRPNAADDSERQLDLPLWTEIGGVGSETRSFSVNSTVGATGRVLLLQHSGHAEPAIEVETSHIYTAPVARRGLQRRDFLHLSPNRTEIFTEPQSLSVQLGSIFLKAANERFESGVISDFAKDIIAVVYNHGGRAVEEIGALMLSEAGNPLVSAEALRSLGQIAHPTTYRERLWVLQRSLRCSSPITRDGATIGLAWLDDPAAIQALEAAIDRETYVGLKQDMQRLLRQLRRRE